MKMKWQTSIGAALCAAVFLPVGAYASDTSIDTVDVVYQGSHQTESSTDYVLDITIADNSDVEPGEYLYIGVVGTTGSDFADSGFDFASTSSAHTGFTGTGDAYGSENEMYRIQLSSQMERSNTYRVKLENVVNPSSAGCFRFATTTTDPSYANEDDYHLSDTFGLGVGCIIQNFYAEAFGRSIGVKWKPYPNATSYRVTYGKSEAGLNAASWSAQSITKTTSSNQLLVQDLDKETTYYVKVSPVHGSDEPVFSSEIKNTLTSIKVNRTRFNQPRVPKKHLGKRLALVRWDRPVARRFVVKYIMQLQTRNGTKIKTFRNISAAYTSKIITKEYLNKDHRYKVRMRVQYVTGEKTMYGDFKYFRTKN
ncbi:MAG: fibronectin type III domain-containing protein [Candidatus Kerfeldbacteria bacterium]